MRRDTPYPVGTPWWRAASRASVPVIPVPVSAPVSATLESAPVSASNGNVHRVLPNFTAPGNEIFPDGCGPYAACTALHTLEPAKYPVDHATLQAIKDTMVQHGWWIFEGGKSGGCSV